MFYHYHSPKRLPGTESCWKGSQQLSPDIRIMMISPCPEDFNHCPAPPHPTPERICRHAPTFGVHNISTDPFPSPPQKICCLPCPEASIDMLLCASWWLFYNLEKNIMWPKKRKIMMWWPKEILYFLRQAMKARFTRRIWTWKLLWVYTFIHICICICICICIWQQESSPGEHGQV